MPIRINLLAEAHELEEQRRRDPVKRAIIGACVLVGLVLIWAASKQVLIMTYKSRLNSLDEQIEAHASEFASVSASQKELNEVEFRLNELTKLATNRLLNGNLMNALEQVAVKDIQLVHFRAEQSYGYVEASKPKPNPTTGVTSKGKPAQSVEKITFSIEARDNSARPGEELLNNWRQSLGTAEYFANLLGDTNEFRLTSRSAPQFSPGSQKPYVTFILEGHVPDRSR